MESTGKEMESLLSMDAVERQSSSSTTRGGASHSPPPHLHRRGLVYGVVGLMVGAMIGFAAHPGTGVSDVAEVVGTEASIGSSSISEDPDAEEAPWPRVAWLMSFPNSGTTYTMKLVRNASLHYTAVNYGHKYIDEILNVSIPVLDDSPNGPFWIDPNGVSSPIGNVTFPYDGYVLTKTHCGTHCFHCDSSAYMETQHQFSMDCLMGKRTAIGPDGGTVLVKGHYDATLVGRAVHLVRNPFNNVVSRFHLYLKHHAGTYTYDRNGFREFCMEDNDNWEYREKKSPLIEESILDIIGHVPCHADFLRYVRWHNMAFTTTRNMQLPTMILHYESYEHRFNQTLMELLDFLGYSFQGDTPDFIAGKDYTDYYTDEERKDVYVALKELSYLDTWVHIRNYFSDW